MVSECPLVKNRGGTVLREDWKPHPLAEDIAHWAKPLADKIRASCWAGRKGVHEHVSLDFSRDAVLSEGCHS